MLGPAILMVRVVHSPVCHTRISPKLSEIDAWLLGNLNRNLGFPIQNLPSDSRSEVLLRYFGCFRVTFSDDKAISKAVAAGAIAVAAIESVVKPMTDDPSSPSKKLVRKTRTRNLDGIEL